MGRKGHNKDADWSDDKKQKAEIRLLRRQVAALRKQLQRVDIDRFENLQTLVDAQTAEDKQFHDDHRKPASTKQWTCFKCKEDFLRLLVINRKDGLFYFRRCPCGNKTKLKRYTSDVQGIRPDQKEET